MEPGFPKRALVNDRGNAVDFGGDGRYIYFPNKFDRTISVLDAASDTIIATINLNSIWPTGQFDGTYYRPILKQIIALRASHAIIIDADPNSATFNTIVDNYTFSSFYSFNQGVIYDAHNDMIRSSTGIYGLLNIKAKATTLAPTSMPNLVFTFSSWDTYFAYSNVVAGGGNNIPFMANIDTNSNTYVFKDFAISAYSGVIFKIGSSLYVFRGGVQKHDVLSLTEIRFRSIVPVSMSMLAYDSVS